jgi:hypothetical protein
LEQVHLLPPTSAQYQLPVLIQYLILSHHREAVLVQVEPLVLILLHQVVQAVVVGVLTPVVHRLAQAEVVVKGEQVVLVSVTTLLVVVEQTQLVVMQLLR